MPKAGAYFLYMLDFKREQEEKCGKSLSMPEVSQMASDSWNAMSEDDKAFYKQKSKGGEMKIQRRNVKANSDSTSLKTTHGIPISVYEEEARAKQLEVENMRRRIGSMVQKLSLTKNFLSYPLYFMYGNYFYKNNDGKYSPAEIGIVKFTFRDGVLKRHHAFIKPENVDLGYAYTAKAHSEDTHRLPPPPNAYGESDYHRVFYDIQKWMKEDSSPVFDGGKQMFFTYHDPYTNEENQIDVLKSFLDQFAGINGHSYDVYPLTRLFYVMRKELAARKKCPDIPTEQFTNVFLSRDPYETVENISCAFHEEKDVTRYCALSRVRRWAFQLADHFCEPLNIQLVGGRHLPKDADISNSAISLNSGTSMHESKTDNSITETSKSEVDTENQIGSIATLNLDDQSIQTASSNMATSRSKRPARGSIVQKIMESQSTQSNITSSTFYNRP